MPPRKRTAAKKAAAKKKPTPQQDAELAEIVQISEPAPKDLEDMLAEYEELVENARENKENKTRREELRDLIGQRLNEEGPRYYVSPSGQKHVAWSTTPETVELDVEKVLKMDEEGAIPFDLIDKIAPRQVNREGLRTAIATGAMTPEQVREAVTLRPQTTRVYSRSLDDDDGDDE